MNLATTRRNRPRHDIRRSHALRNRRAGRTAGDPACEVATAGGFGFDQAVGAEEWVEMDQTAVPGTDTWD
ncbi:hypothetical protein DRQ32_06645 [bacterium]|nr:MAG: hypothetical protein DRQ32_06645 [bacterium]